MSETMPEPTLPWAKVTETPTRYKITRAGTQPGKMGRPDTVIELDGNCKITVWGANYMYLFNTFGRNSADWVGKYITVHKNKEGHRVVEEVRN